MLNFTTNVNMLMTLLETVNEKKNIHFFSNNRSQTSRGFADLSRKNLS